MGTEIDHATQPNKINDLYKVPPADFGALLVKISFYFSIIRQKKYRHGAPVS
jgi:hypothetical protein